MKKEHVFTTVLIILVWSLFSVILHNDILLPSPWLTFSSLYKLVTSKTAWTAIGATAFRTAEGVLIAAAAAFVFAVFSALSETFRRYTEPLCAVLNTIPNISYIIIALIWLGSEGSSLTVIFMILFPVFLGSFNKVIAGEHEKYASVLQLYPAGAAEKLQAYILPMLVRDLVSTCRTAVPLAFKVGVMSEILGAVRAGIGRSLQYCRTSLDMAGIFAWTIVIIVIASLAGRVFTAVSKQLDGH